MRLIEVRVERVWDWCGEAGIQASVRVGRRTPQLEQNMASPGISAAQFGQRILNPVLQATIALLVRLILTEKRVMRGITEL